MSLAHRQKTCVCCGRPLETGQRTNIEPLIDPTVRYVIVHYGESSFPMTNAELAAEQIRKHGKDRYPTIPMQFNKLVEEVGELAKEVNKAYVAYTSGIEVFDVNRTNLKGEAADCALALYNLAAKCGFDLDSAIRTVVDEDVRKF